jgi:outer membrane protein assembly factor BamB
VSVMILVRPADANRSAEGSEHLFALDANTGQERWRYPEAGSGSACLEQPIVTADTYFGVRSQALHAVNLATGRDRWKPVEVRQPVDGRVRGVPIGGLVDAGSVVIGMTPGVLVAFDKGTGQTAWEIAGQYRVGSPSTAVAGRVLYFQGHPGATPTTDSPGTIVYSGGRPITTAVALPGGKLNALDLDTRTILWSFYAQPPSLTGPSAL